MASLFVEQGAVMKTTVSNLKISPACLALTYSVWQFLCQRVIDPLVGRIKKSDSKGLTELQRMGIGPVIATMAMVSAGIVGCYGLKYAIKECTECEGSSSLIIFWQIPQYAFVGASEVFMYV